MLELKTRVEELKMENEYQLRLKDMNYSEKIKELTDKFIQEMESLKTKNQVCLRQNQRPQVPRHSLFTRACAHTLRCEDVSLESIAGNVRNDPTKC